MLDKELVWNLVSLKNWIDNTNDWDSAHNPNFHQLNFTDNIPVHGYGDKDGYGDDEHVLNIVPDVKKGHADID